ncbi:nucleotidyltransferase family protein [Patescibacteria group bacterium]|nr:nucleotidyltransferase family protein [Patescibacteria group bacterium]
MSNEFKKNIKIINQNLNSLKNDYGVKKIGIFGSFVNGKPRKDSDIDVLVEFSQPVDFFDFLDLEDYLSKILKRKVDLATKNALKPIIKKRILKQVIYV